MGLLKLFPLGVCTWLLAVLLAAGADGKPGNLRTFLSYHEPLSFDVRELHRRHAVYSASSSAEHFDFHFAALNRSFNLRMKQDTEVLLPNFELHVRESDNHTRLMDIDRRAIVAGTLIGQETMSDASFVMTKSGMIGSIFDREARETYFIEEAAQWYDDPPFTHVVYRMSDLLMNMSEALERSFEGDAYARMVAMQQAMQATATAAPPARHRRYDKATQNTCELAMVSDFLFYANNGQSSVATTTNLLISWVASMTRIYKFASFTGVGLGIQFALRQITVYTTTSNIYTTSSTNVNLFLDIASQGDPLLGNWNSVCLAHVLTHRTFDNGILGLAWVGSSNAGICAKSAQFSGGTKSLNTGISTSENFGANVPAIVSIITMAHECGHNFGSTHDLPGSSSGGSTCAPGDSNGGNYIMYATASTGLLPNNNQFSQCSLDIMGSLIVTRGASCFTNRGQSAICGNGIFEGSPEQCDCGIDPAVTNASARCSAIDPCCTPTCTFAASAACSPRSGSCCNSNCTLFGYPKQNDGVYPSPENSTVAPYKCSEVSSCRRQRFCIADPLFLGACPPLDFIIDPANPTLNVTINASIPTCEDSGPPCYLFHEPTGTPCTGALCSVTGCDLSLCQLYQTTSASGLVPPANYTRTAASPCQLTSASLYAGLECEVSCQFEPGVCVSTFAYATTADGIAQGINGTFRAAGTYCSSYRGRCDGAGRCVAIQTDNAIDAIAELNIGSWITNNWYIVLAAGGGVILLIILLRVTYQRKKIPIQNALRRLGQTLRRGGRGGAGAAGGAGGRNPALAAAARPGKGRPEQRISREQGFRRLQRFFPTAADPAVILTVMKKSKSEEEAVLTLLRQGLPLAALEPNTL